MMNGESFIHDFLKTVTRQGMRVLDLGCGPGRFKDSIKGHYVGLDMTCQDYKPGWRRVTDVEASARFLPFKKEAFDLVFTVASLHLFPGPVLCLKEVFQSLKEEGRFVCFEYTRRVLEGFVVPYHETGIYCHSIWTGEQLARLFKVAGFRDVRYRVPFPNDWRRALASLVGPVYQHVHDYRKGWWAVEGVKRQSVVRGARK